MSRNIRTNLSNN